MVAEGKRWRDHQGSVLAVVCSKLSGCFAKLKISSASQKRTIFICILAEKKWWRMVRTGGECFAVSEEMARLVVKEKQQQTQVPVGAAIAGPVGTATGSYADV